MTNVFENLSRIMTKMRKIEQRVNKNGKYYFQKYLYLVRRSGGGEIATRMYHDKMGVCRQFIEVKIVYVWVIAVD